LKYPIYCVTDAIKSLYPDINSFIQNRKNGSMKPAYSALFVLILVFLIGDPVISDRLTISNYSGGGDIVSYLGTFDYSGASELIEIDLLSLFFLLCIGFIGIISVSRKRSGKYTK